MSIRAKLLLGFLGVSLIGALIGLVGILSLNNIKAADEHAFNNGTQGLIIMFRVTDAFDRIKVAIRDEALSVTDEDNEKIHAQYEKAVAEFEKSIGDYGSTLATDEDRENYRALQGAAATYISFTKKVMDLGLQNLNSEAAALIRDPASAPILSEVIGAVAKVVDYNVRYNTDIFNANSAATDLAVILMLSILVLGVVFSIALGLVVTNSITKPVGRVNHELSEASKALESASFQVSSSSQELSSSSSELASSIEEMTSSLEELQSIIEANTKNVNQSELLMQETNRDAKKVAERVTELKDALVDISGQSKKISKIIKVIDDIAFQTNILALNAAVEAARAGDAGKGFAVVADQVKALAQKSADAAKETADLIEKAIEASDRGERLGGEVKEAQDANAEKSEKVAVLLDEVNRGSKEQLKGANQITVAVTQINSIVQNTASSSEENAAAGEELASQSEALAQNVVQLSRIINGKAAEKDAVRTPAARTKTAPKPVSPPPTGQKRIQGVEVTKPEDIIPLKDFKDF